MQFWASQTEARVVVSDRLTGVLHCRWYTFVNLVKIIGESVEGVPGGSGSDPDRVDYIVELPAEIYEILASLNGGLSDSGTRSSNASTYGDSLQVYALE